MCFSSLSSHTLPSVTTIAQLCNVSTKRVGLVHDTVHGLGEWLFACWGTIKYMQLCGLHPHLGSGAHTYVVAGPSALPLLHLYKQLHHHGANIMLEAPASWCVTGHNIIILCGKSRWWPGDHICSVTTLGIIMSTKVYVVYYARPQLLQQGARASDV